MIVVVTGGRDYADAETVNRVLSEVHAEYEIDLLVHGAASGADSLADGWAKANNVRSCPCPADWSRLGRRAGPVRNRYMLDAFKPDLVVAFPGGAGTADCVRAAEERGIRVLKAE
jgi:hypothetical protein